VIVYCYPLFFSPLTSLCAPPLVCGEFDAQVKPLFNSAPAALAGFVRTNARIRMTPCNKEVAQTARTPVLSATLLARVHELNRNYVDLLAAQAGIRNVDAQGLPPKVLDTLAQLSAPARLRLAASPFALYALGFEDQQFWRTVLAEDGVADRDDALANYYGTSSVAPAIVFSEVALFFAWHTAVVNRVSARVLFAMPEALAERMVQTPLWRLRKIAAEFPGLLQPRWPTNPGFWPDLVRFAAAADWCRLQTAQLLGNQLTAVDLDAAFDEGRMPGNRGRRIDMTKARAKREC
jgi:hypothetical protein